MKINEITMPGRWYECRVRIVNDGLNVITNTVVNGDTRSGVLAMMMKLYGRNNVVSVNEISGTNEDVEWSNNEISDVLSEKSYGAPNTKVKGHDTMNRRPFTPEQLQVKSLEKKARDEVKSGDVPGSVQAKAQVALKKAQIKKNKAQQDYTNKAMNLSQSRGLMKSID